MGQFGAQANVEIHLAELEAEDSSEDAVVRLGRETGSGKHGR